MRCRVAPAPGSRTCFGALLTALLVLAVTASLAHADSIYDVNACANGTTQNLWVQDGNNGVNGYSEATSCGNLAVADGNPTAGGTTARIGTSLPGGLAFREALLDNMWIAQTGPSNTIGGAYANEGVLANGLWVGGETIGGSNNLSWSGNEDLVFSPSWTDWTGASINSEPTSIQIAAQCGLNPGDYCYDLQAEADVQGETWFAIDDSSSGPNISSSSTIPTSSWVNGNTIGSNDYVSVSATDPGSVCELDATGFGQTGEESYPASRAGDGSYYSYDPCWGGDNGNSGSYAWHPNLTGVNSNGGYITVGAENPALASGRATKLVGPFYIDSSRPTIAASSTLTSTSWYPSANSLPAINVTATEPYSGVNRITCTNSANSDTYTVNASSGTIPSSDLAQGVNTWTCNSYNNVGTESATPSTITARVDSTPPTAAISTTASPNSWYSSVASIPTVNVTNTAGPSGVAQTQCSGPGIATQDIEYAGTAPISLTGLQNGTTTIRCVTTSDSGVTGAAATITLHLDAIAPTVQLSSQASSSKWYPSVAAIPAVSTSATTGPSGLSAYTCTGDGIASQTFTSTSGNDLALTGLNQGAGNLTCQATSVAGITGPAATFQLEQDSTVPTLSYTTNESQSEWYPSTAAVPTITAVGASTGGSGVANISCTLPNGGQTLPGSSGPVDLGSQANGAITLACTPTSGAGLQGTPIDRTIQIDDSVPSIKLEGTNASTWYSSARLLQADASTNSNPSGIASVDCTIDGSDQGAVNGDTGAYTITGSSVHTASCTAVSGAGVTSQAASTTVRIDAQSPSTALQVTAAPAGSPAGAVAVAVTGSEATNLSGIASTSCSVDGAAATTNNGPTQTITMTGPGDHTLNCTSSTASGVQGPATTGDYTVAADSVSVPLSVQSPGNGAWVTGPADVTATLPAADAGAYANAECATDNNSPTTLPATGGTIPVAGNGSHTIACWEVGNNGYSTNAVSAGVDVDNQQPQITDAVTPIPSGGDTVKITSTEPSKLSGIATTSCTLDGQPVAGSSNTTTITVTGVGSHSIACESSTAAGASAHATFTINVAAAAPGTPTLPAIVNPGQWYTTDPVLVPIDVPTTVPPTTAVICTADAQTITTPVPAGATEEKVAIPAPGGDVSCVDQNADGETSPPLTFTIHIDGSGPTLALTSAGPNQITGTASDSGSGLQKVSVLISTDRGRTWTPIAVTLNTDGTFSAQLPKLPAGTTYDVEAIALDQAGNKTVVTTINGQPAIDTVPTPTLSGPPASTTVAAASTTASPTASTTTAPEPAASSIVASLYAGTIAPGTKTMATKTKTVAVTRKVKVKVHGKIVPKTVPVYITKKEKIHGHTKLVKTKKTTTKEVKVETIANPSHGSTINTTYSQAATATGKVLDAAGQPLAGQTVEILAAPIGAGGPVTTIKTVAVTRKTKVKVHGKTVLKTVPVYITKKEKLHGHTTVVKTKKTRKVKTTTIIPNPPAVQIATATTATNGTWSSRITAGPSRTLTFQVAGSSATTHGTIRVAGSVKLTAPKTINTGKAIRLTVVAKGVTRPLKATIQEQVGKHGQWRNLPPITLSAKGRGTTTAAITQPPAHGGLVNWRAKIAAQTGWTYQPLTTTEMAARIPEIRARPHRAEPLHHRSTKGGRR